MAGRSPSGFTLIELMIAIAVFGILMMAALPSFRIWIQNTQVRTAAEGIFNGLQLARAEAVRRNAKTELELSGSGWTLRVVTSGEVIQTRPASEGSDSAVITVLPAGATKASFDGTGRVTTNGDASAPITEIKIDTNAIPAADSRELCVVVGAAGLVKLCDPTVSGADTRACPVKVPAYCP
jgi:type IV fimbrial biogenesis protein FimT